MPLKQKVSMQQFNLFDLLNSVNENLPDENSFPHNENLPDENRFPHNEKSVKVRKILQDDLLQDDILIITGYASVSEIIKLLSMRHQRSGQIRILLGNEPFPSTHKHVVFNQLQDDVRDYWLDRGISLFQAKDLFKAQKLLETDTVEIRIANSKKVHAKIFVSQKAVVLGSSNFTANGLEYQSEANVRFSVKENERYDEAKQLAEHMWKTGSDYTEEFNALIHQLLLPVNWREALARACSQVLEGDWAEKYLPFEELNSLSKQLWPHQRQGLSQALWILTNLGSVLISDAAGSGKTKMGSWILRALYELQYKLCLPQNAQTIMITPPAVITHWEDANREARLPLTPRSHGLLSQKECRNKELLMADIKSASILAVDEAHNFINQSTRTRSLLNHYADHVVLFTATPINREASDLLSMVELLGADNFSESAQDNLKKLKRMNTKNQEKEAKLIVQKEIQSFLVRRTREDLNQLSEQNASAYQLPNGRHACYPRHHAEYYSLTNTEQDEHIMQQILKLCDQLNGIARFGQKLYLPVKLKNTGLTEEAYLKKLLRSTCALARYTIMDCLRSSRIAAYEHILGTEKALSQFMLDLGFRHKNSTGDTVSKLSEIKGLPPVWAFQELKKSNAPDWLYAPEKHLEICLQEIDIYQQIAFLITQLSDQRECQKIEHLKHLSARKGLVIAFDSHIISLELFYHQLKSEQYSVKCFTGAQGASGKLNAVADLGRGTKKTKLIALCSDALSEGMNLQGASVVMHLDSPTVIRVAEQRAGRVDRMDSEHDDVEIWWPKHEGGFQLTEKDKLKFRHYLVKDLIGANLELPDEEDDIEDWDQLPKLASPDKQPKLESFFDAFHSVNDLIGEQGLISNDLYQNYRRSTAKVMSCFSMVQSMQSWAFFAIGGPERIAPRWVLIHSDNKMKIITSLDEIAVFLREHLKHEPESCSFDDQVQIDLDRFLHLLSAQQIQLLPKRKQKALELAKSLIQDWNKQAKIQGDMARVRLLNKIEMYFTPVANQESPDLGALAKIWLDLFRPYQTEYMKTMKRHTLFQLDLLKKSLKENPISTEKLKQAYQKVPYLNPLSERVVAAIIGIPTESRM